VTLNINATLTLDNTGTNLSGRLMSGASPANVTLNNALFNFLGNNTPGVVTTETLGTVTLNSGASFFNQLSGSGFGATAVVTVSMLSRNAGSTVSFLPYLNPTTTQTPTTGSALNTAFNRILVSSLGTGAALVNGILPWATIALWRRSSTRRSPPSAPSTTSSRWRPPAAATASPPSPTTRAPSPAPAPPIPCA